MMKKWFGRRVIKTGLAVLTTASICQLLHLSPTFAVITAIVTTEPTVADSIRKGVIRLPAAALGAIFALTATTVLGQHAISYALVAMLTIIVCSKLQFDTGTLVATLTAVAMIPDTTNHALFDFASRVSATSIGIFVSTLVNFVILPPKFGPLLVEKVDSLFKRTAKDFYSMLEMHLSTQSEPNQNVSLLSIHEELIKAYQLAHYQDDESQYRSSSEYEQRSFDYLHKKLDYLQLSLYHIGKIAHLKVNQPLTNREIKLILVVIHSLHSILHDHYHQITSTHLTSIEQLKALKIVHQSSNSFIFKLCHELLSLHDVVTELSLLTADERRISLQEKKYPEYIFRKQFMYE